MLSTLRTATRSLRPSTRFSSTLAEGNAPSQWANSGLQAVIASQQTSPVASTSKPNLPVMLNIPPAEDPLLHYLTSSIMKHGRRSKASRTTSRTLLHLHSFTRTEPLPLLREAIFAASPAVKCLSHRHGSKNVMKPVALGEKQRTKFAVKWILEASDSKPGKTLEERLAREVIAVLEGNSRALAKKMELHRIAMVNRYVSNMRTSSLLLTSFQGQRTSLLICGPRECAWLLVILDLDHSPTTRLMTAPEQFLHSRHPKY